jgi:hypothetical protein
MNIETNKNQHAPNQQQTCTQNQQTTKSNSNLARNLNKSRSSSYPSGVWTFYLCIYYMSRWYCNKSKSQLTSPTPAQSASCCIISGTYSIYSIYVFVLILVVYLMALKRCNLWEFVDGSYKYFQAWLDVLPFVTTFLLRILKWVLVGSLDELKLWVLFFCHWTWP